MSNNDFTTSFLVDKSPKEAFDAINNVRGWWKEDLTGGTSSVNDEFSVRFGDIHYSRHKLTEVIPDTKIVWLTTDGSLSFVEDKGEWIGSTITFDITPKGNQTEVRFTQQGLTPSVECYDNCSGAWGWYMQNSLKELIETGKGQPTP
ncbi:MAG: SRPBCC family protein [Mucilaginibacter sp.]